MKTPTRRHLAAELLLIAGAFTVDLLIWSDDNGLDGGGSSPSWVVPVGSAATLASLSLRHRYPPLVLVVQLVWASAVGSLFEDYTPTLGILIALHALARQSPPARSLPWWAGCALPFLTYALGLDSGALWTVTGLIVLMLVAGGAWLLGYRAWLADRSSAERETAAAEALRAERLRIARELHDIVAHAVSVMMIQSAGARAVLAVDPKGAEAALDVVQDVGRQSMNELRRLLGLLRSAAGDGDGTSVEQQPDLDGLEQLLDHARGAGLTVSKQERGMAGALDPSVGLTAYRIVQESLTNALKHAGPGTTVQVELAWEEHRLLLTVRNDAPRPGRRTSGAAQLSSGLGLLGLRERVQTVGGTLETGPTATGFEVDAVLPVAVRPAPAAVPPITERVVG
ncbi:histidine kinase [Actinoplanes sp. NPDC051851]|uniref:sensor histidine kinase n=1 Tax=Actinoplanes sp. NPDC051851 TaxID=3154753 RepID=UPI0034435B37